jgi:Secretion system C-terminal sorting domain
MVKTGKIVILMLLSLFVGFRCMAQSHDEAIFSERQDPGKSVQIFPNPATDYVTLRFETPRAKYMKLSLHTIIGNLLEVETEVIDEYELRIKVRELPSGYYLLAINDAESNSRNIYKIVKR